MKKLLFTTLVSFAIMITVFAQAPGKMSYQAIIRDASSQLIMDKEIGMKISILKGSVTGSAVYVETQKPTTNSNGLIAIEIGGGSVVTGVFANIVWGEGPYFIKTEVDPLGGTSYTISGTSQFLSVPYSLHAQSAKLLSETTVTPRVSSRGQMLSVSFTGGEKLSFSQGSATCPTLTSDVLLRHSQGSTTILTPIDVYHINANRFDAYFDIPTFIPVGLYDIIISPNSACSTNIPASFKIN